MELVKSAQKQGIQDSLVFGVVSLKNNWSCCTKESPCGEKHGDCDVDEHCMEGLKCGTDNCRSMYSNISFPNIDIQMDCCYKVGK